jgi:hypothetical protein
MICVDCEYMVSCPQMESQEKIPMKTRIITIDDEDESLVSGNECVGNGESPASKLPSANKSSPIQLNISESDDDVVFVREIKCAKEDDQRRRKRAVDSDRQVPIQTRSKKAPADQHLPQPAINAEGAPAPDPDERGRDGPKIKVLAPDSAEYREVLARFQQSMPNTVVDAIEAVVDPVRQAEHERIRAALLASGVDPNPQRLCFGASTVAWAGHPGVVPGWFHIDAGQGVIAKIIQDGFACSLLLGRTEVNFCRSACIASYWQIMESSPRRRILLLDVLAVHQPPEPPRLAPADGAANQAAPAGGAEPPAGLECVQCDIQEAAWYRSTTTFVCLHDEQASPPPLPPLIQQLRLLSPFPCSFRI